MRVPCFYCVYILYICMMEAAGEGLNKVPNGVLARVCVCVYALQEAALRRIKWGL